MEWGVDTLNGSSTPLLSILVTEVLINTTNMTVAFRVQGCANFLHLLGVAADPKPALAELNGFLLAASWLGFPPRPLKKPPPLPVFPDPNTLPLDDEGC